MKINFFNESKTNQKEVKEFTKLICKVLNNVGKKEFNIIFVDDEEIQRINREFRKIDRVTDVISFALCDDVTADFSDELGDIFIDLDQAKRQAVEYGHSISREVAFLAVHGYLHLCGYDHMTEEEEKVMFSKQEDILRNAGIGRE